MDIITIIATIVGSVGGASGLLTLYTLRQKRDSFSIENMTRVVTEIKSQHASFKEEANEKIDKLENRLNKLDLKDQMQTRAINKGYRCEHLLAAINKKAHCPIICEFETEMRAIEGLSKIKE